MAGKPQTLATTSAFEILGPVMVGPSSSHTAGALRCAQVAASLLEGRITKVTFELWNSFAHTYRGHGTDRALVAGLLGMKPDDLRIPNAFEEAKKAGLRYTIDEIDLRDVHPNTAVLELTGKGGRALTVQASSLGGGRIMVKFQIGKRIVVSREKFLDWLNRQCEEQKCA